MNQGKSIVQHTFEWPQALGMSLFFGANGDHERFQAGTYHRPEARRAFSRPGAAVPLCGSAKLLRVRTHVLVRATLVSALRRRGAA